MECIKTNESRAKDVEDGVNYFSGERNGYYFIFRGKDPLSDRNAADKYLRTNFISGIFSNFLKNDCIFSCKVSDDNITKINYNFDETNQDNIDKLNRIINSQNSEIGRNYIENLLSKVLNIQDAKSVDIFYDTECNKTIPYLFFGNSTLKKLRDISLKSNTQMQFKNKAKNKITDKDIENLSNVIGNFTHGKKIIELEENENSLINSLNGIKTLIENTEKNNQNISKNNLQTFFLSFEEYKKCIQKTSILNEKIVLLKSKLLRSIKNRDFNNSKEILKSLEDEIKEETRKSEIDIACKIQSKLENQYDNFFKELNKKVLNKTQCSYIRCGLFRHAILLKVERTNGDKIKIIPYDPSGSFSEDLCINISNIPPNNGKTNYEIFFEYFKDWKINNPEANIEFASPEEVLNIKTPQGNQGFCSYHTLAMAKTFADRDKYNREKLDSLQNNKQIKALKNDLLKKAYEIMEQEEDEKLQICYLKQINVLEKLKDKDKIKDFIIEHVNQAPFYIKDNNILMTDTQFECNRVVNTFLHSMSLPMIDYHTCKGQTRNNIRIPYNELGEIVFKASMGNQEAIGRLENEIQNKYIKTNLKKIVEYLRRYRKVIKDKIIKDENVKNENIEDESVKNEKLYLDNIDQGNGGKKRINGILSENYFYELSYNASGDKRILEDLNLKNNDNLRQEYSQIDNIEKTLVSFAKEITTNNEKNFSSLIESENYKNIHFEKIRYYLNVLRIPENKECDLYRNNLQNRLNLLKNYVECFDILKSSSDLIEENKRLNAEASKFKIIKPNQKDTICIFNKITNAKNRLFENISEMDKNNIDNDKLNAYFKMFKEETQAYTREFQLNVKKINGILENKINSKKIIPEKFNEFKKDFGNFRARVKSILNQREH